MQYRVLAYATVVVHLAFVLYVVIGGFIAWRYRRTIWLHLAAFGWGFSTIVLGFSCPLTHLEDWARIRSGEQGLPSSGFIDHYITGVIYPANYLELVRVLVLVCVAGSWIGYLALGRRVAPASGS